MVGLFSRVLEAVKPQQQTRREEDAKTKNVTRIRNAAKKIEKVKTICDLGKMHARSMRDNSLDPDVLASERKNYEMYKHDALVVMGSLRDTTLRDSSLRLIIDLCVHGGDHSEARHLYNAIEAISVKREILEVHPQLGL